jgi:radical SAM protein with 4Fe4S-binding SPASM domain
MTRHVLPWYVPPTLLAKQLLSAATVAKATGWRLNARWIRDAKPLVETANGATGIGCFGYPPHPVYEVTTMCNLRCAHCHAAAGRPSPGELDTPQAMKVIESLTTVREFRTLVFTGGEPLLRKDIWELTHYARQLGFGIVYATNATLIDEETAARMAKLDVLGAAVSLDSTRPEIHDKIRGVPGAWRKAVKGIINLKKQGLYVQINITANKLNFDEIPQLLKLSDKLGAHVVFLYTFVSTGRGAENKWLSLTPRQFYTLALTAAKTQEEVQSLIIPVAMPWYYALLADKAKLNPQIAKKWVSGCIAARGMFYIKPNGDVWPCAFLPLKAGNLLEKPAAAIWHGQLFNQIKNRENLEEPCRSCPYRDICGGCRARAYISTGRLTAPDPLCPLVSNKSAQEQTRAK